MVLRCCRGSTGMVSHSCFFANIPLKYEFEVQVIRPAESVYDKCMVLHVAADDHQAETRTLQYDAIAYDTSQ